MQKRNDDKITDDPMTMLTIGIAVASIIFFIGSMVVA